MVQVRTPGIVPTRGTSGGNKWVDNWQLTLILLIIAIESYIVQAKRKKEIVTRQKSKAKN